MAKKKGGLPNRLAYLDDYKKGLDGKYVYYGRHYIFQGSEKEQKSYKRSLGILIGVQLVLFILGGCMDGGAIWNSWYVIIPYAVEALGVFLYLWKGINFLVEKVPLKAYVYKRSIPWFKPCFFIMIIGALLSFAMTILCMLLQAQNIKLLGCILFLLISLAMAAAGFVGIKVLDRYGWILDPEEELQE